MAQGSACTHAAQSTQQCNMLLHSSSSASMHSEQHDECRPTRTMSQHSPVVWTPSCIGNTSAKRECSRQLSAASPKMHAQHAGMLQHMQAGLITSKQCCTVSKRAITSCAQGARGSLKGGCARSAQHAQAWHGCITHDLNRCWEAGKRSALSTAKVPARRHKTGSKRRPGVHGARKRETSVDSASEMMPGCIMRWVLVV